MASRRSARLSTASTSVQDIVATSKSTTAPSTVANTGKKRENIAKTPSEAQAIDAPTASPQTPKKRKVSKAAQPPETPTPAVIGLMSAASNLNPNQNLTTPRVNRLAAPDATNATLLTPETHRVVAAKPLSEVSPSKVSNATTTTANILQDALAHLIKVEPKLKPIIDRNFCKVFSPAGLAEKIDPFNSLVSSIISQQVSGAAAKSIKAKFVTLFNTEIEDVTQHIFPTPSQIVASNIPVLRTAGLSQRKAEYIHGLAEKFHSGEITTSMLFTASYEDILETLIKVRGLGRWSVEMFACFALKRLDVFSTGDLGVQRGMAAFKGRDVAKLKNGKGKWQVLSFFGCSLPRFGNLVINTPFGRKYMGEKEMEETAEKFRPYRSVFMWYMWRVEETDISTLES